MVNKRYGHLEEQKVGEYNTPDGSKRIVVRTHDGNKRFAILQEFLGKWILFRYSNEIPPIVKDQQDNK